MAVFVHPNIGDLLRKSKGTVEQKRKLTDDDISVSNAADLHPLGYYKVQKRRRQNLSVITDVAEKRFVKLTSNRKASQELRERKYQYVLDLGARVQLLDAGNRELAAKVVALEQEQRCLLPAPAVAQGVRPSFAPIPDVLPAQPDFAVLDSFDFETLDTTANFLSNIDEHELFTRVKTPLPLISASAIMTSLDTARSVDAAGFDGIFSLSGDFEDSFTEAAATSDEILVPSVTDFLSSEHSSFSSLPPDYLVPSSCSLSADTVLAKSVKVSEPAVLSSLPNPQGPLLSGLLLMMLMVSIIFSMKFGSAVLRTTMSTTGPTGPSRCTVSRLPQLTCQTIRTGFRRPRIRLLQGKDPLMSVF